MFPYIDENHKIPTYGVLFFFGIAAAFLASFFLRKKDAIKADDFFYGVAFALIGGFIGAKLFAVIPNIRFIKDNKIPFVDVIKTGFVFYGGLMGGAAGILLYCHKYKIDVINFFDTAAVGLPLGSVFGRIGCFAAGCCYGKHSNSFWGVIYTHPADPNTPIGVPLLPVQLYESAFCLLLFIALAVLRNRMKKGGSTALYAVGYSVFRFIIEFFRGDLARGQLWGISTSQYISLLIIITCATAAAFKVFSTKKHNNF